jgi:hypothetical protein
MPYTHHVFAVWKTLHIFYEVYAGAIIIPRILDVYCEFFPGMASAMTTIQKIEGKEET